MIFVYVFFWIMFDPFDCSVIQGTLPLDVLLACHVGGSCFGENSEKAPRDPAIDAIAGLYEDSDEPIPPEDG